MKSIFSNRMTFWVVLAVVAIAAMLLVLGHTPGHNFTPDLLSGLGALGGMPMLIGDTKSVAEQITAFEAKKTDAQNKASGIMQRAADEGRTLDEAEAEEHDGLLADVKGIDDHITRLKAHEQTMVVKATPVDANTGAGTGSRRQEPARGHISVQRNLPTGTAFTRFVMAMAAAKGNFLQAERLAESFKDTPEVGNVIKALSYLGASSGEDIAMKTAVASGTTSDATWAAPLVQYQNMQAEFIELLRPATILGRLNSLRRVPFNVRLPRQTAGASSQFVGEGLPSPVGKPAFDNVTLPWAKASTIVVITAELARMSNPAAEALVRQDLIDGCAQYLDKRLVDPAFAGVANVSPASLTNGVTAVQATGATLGAVDADVATVMSAFAAAEHSLLNGVWVMDATTAIRLSMIRTAHGDKAFPELSMKGGDFYGMPVLVSNNVAGSGSPGDRFLILIDQSEVLLADDGQMMIDVSTEASVQMNDAPSAGAASLVSLWQNGLLGVKVDRWIYWTKRRSTAVQFIDAAQRYGS